jgi:glucose-6-phosphate 1-epimerase
MPLIGMPSDITGCMETTLLGAPVVVLANATARVIIARHGAHVLSFENRTADGWKERLWLSPVATITAGKAIRGGIPICWPWFGPHPSDTKQPQHGLVRTRAFDLNLLQVAFDGNPVASFEISGRDCGSTALDPEARLQVDVSLAEHTLNLALTTYAGSRDLVLSQAAHTYFAVDDVETVRIETLNGETYRDQADQNRMKTFERDFDFKSEVNAHFAEGPASLALEANATTFATISTEGFEGTVVWNPGRDAARSFPELPGDSSRRFVCVESANLPARPITVAAGETHTALVTYRFQT